MSTNFPTDFCPYKGLQPYTEQDQAFFFGRGRDQRIIGSNLYAAPLTVFYGASGVGKSSVLLAGAVPSLAKERNLTVVVFRNWQDSGFLSQLKQETLAAVSKTVKKELNIDLSLPLDDFLVQLSQTARGSIFFIFDQFEEYFLYNPPGPNSETFEAEFARAINRQDVSAHFLLSMREDGLSKLDRFQGRIPTLLNNMLRLEHLDQAGARAAITKPLDVYNQRLSDGQGKVTIEAGLVDAILDDMRGVKAIPNTTAQVRLEDILSAAPAMEIETPLLQMILTRLWDEERAAGSSVLRLQTFEKLGRAENIARTHLDTIMEGLTPAELHDAANILRYMVTPSGTKIAQEASALASWTELSEATTQSILTRLSDSDMRILRIVQAPGQPTLYEIFHDVLAQAILNWRRRYVQEQKTLEAERQIAVERAQTAEQLARQRVRAKRLGLVAIGLLVASLAMIYLYIDAKRAKTRAIAGEALAKSNPLVASSTAALNSDPELSVLLAMKAVEISPTQKTKDALINALLHSHARTVMLGHNAPVRHVAFSPDGQYVVTASWEDHTARVWEVATGKSVCELKGHSPKEVNAAAFSNDGRYVLTGGHDGKAIVWEGWQTGNPQVLKTIDEKKKQIWTAQFSPPNDDYILTGGDDGTVRVWAWKNSPPTIEAELSIGSATSSTPIPRPTPTPTPGPEPTPVASPTPPPPRVSAVLVHRAAFSQNGEYIIVATGKPTILIWDWKNHRRDNNALRLTGHLPNSVVYDAAFSRNGDYAVSGGTDSTAKVWEWTKPGGTKPLDLNLLPDRVRSVAFSPDGNFIATATDDGRARLWNWRTSKTKDDAIALYGHHGSVFYVAYSRDGEFVVTGGEDKTARVWRTKALDISALPASVDELLKFAQQRLSPQRQQLTAEEKKRYLEE